MAIQSWTAPGASGGLDLLGGANVAFRRAIIGVAVDLTNNLLWFISNTGTEWNNSASANPSTGIGGISITSGTYFPMFTARDAGGFGPDTGILLAGGTAPFVIGAPSGFTAWGSSTAWNPSDKQANITLSTTYQTNDTASGATANTWMNVRANNSQSSGKWYFEVICEQFSDLNGQCWMCGIGTSAASLTTNLGGDSHGYAIDIEGREAINNGSSLGINLQSNGWNTYFALLGQTSHASGQYYFEIALGTVNSTGSSSVPDIALGIATASQSLTTNIGGNGAGYGAYNSGGNLRVATGSGFATNAEIQASNTFATGNTLCVAVDLTNHLLWFRINNGNWSNSVSPFTAAGNPVVGSQSGGISITSGTYFPAFSANNDGSASGPPVTGESGTLNTLPTSFTYTAPSGYSSWDSFPIVSASITEAGAAADTDKMNFLSPITETGHAKDTVTLFQANQPYKIVEHGTAADTVSRPALALGIIERGHAKDAESAPSNTKLAIAETGQARDAFSLPGGAQQGGLLFWGYDYLVGQTVTVWCVGLDCGDHVVASNGTVFVPWFADPDGLFTAAYLVSMNTPDPVSRPTACNVDLTIGGVLTRITVDVSIGFCYTSQLQLLQPDVPQDDQARTGAGVGEIRRTSQFKMSIVNSGAPAVGQGPSNLLQVQFQTPWHTKYLLSQPYSGVWTDSLQGDWDDEAVDGTALMVQIVRPYPFVLRSLGGFMHTSERVMPPGEAS